MVAIVVMVKVIAGQSPYKACHGDSECDGHDDRDADTDADVDAMLLLVVLLVDFEASCC